MAVNWTDDQQKAIETTDKGVIVSAAAGSGKTAVLIERTIRLLIDEQHKIPADRLLAVTFTKDATNQMKDKLSAALDKKLEENPDNIWIQKQQDNLAMAKINTINAFCLDIVKNNIHEFELQSGIKILDDVEADVIICEAISNAFEDFYANKPDVMSMLIDRLTDNSDKALEKIIKEMYNFLRSLPFPDYWCQNALSLLKSGNCSAYIKIVLKNYTETVEKACKKFELCEALIHEMAESDGFSFDSDSDVLDYLDNKHRNLFSSDKEILYDLKNVLESGDWCRIYDEFESYAFSTSKITLKAEDNSDRFIKETNIELLKALRKEYKDLVGQISKDIAKTGRDIKQGIVMSAGIFEGLWDLCKKVEELAWETKVQRNALEFSDVEIMTIKLLIKATPDGLKRTDLAEEMVKSKEYQVILIDEFQDVNNLQELIFKAISDTDDLSVMGKNVFVVGDVKQSIYRFRQSNPLLFINAKKDAENDDFAQLESFKLKKNFRSRKSVVDFVNFTFNLLMSNRVGEVEYTEDEKLQKGSDYEEYHDSDTEIMLVKNVSESENEDSDDENSDFYSFDAEHFAVAMKIKEMCGERYPVYDNGKARPCRPSDFCVLSRGKKTGFQVANALEAVGLKAYTEENSGYLRSREIAVMINMLRVIDNPMQDMALVSVMMSSIMGFTANDVAEIRLKCRDENGFYSKRIYQVMNSFVKDNDEKDSAEKSEQSELNNPVLEEKCVNAVLLIKRLRFYASGMTLEHLIRKIYDETDFFAVASAYENGKQKRANLRLMLEYALAYENNSDGGVAGFLRYLDSAAQNGGDFKQAVTVTESSDSVFVKTIHKSKGLEFPFVFLCGLNKNFNLSDISKRVLFHEQMGVSMKISNHAELSVTEPINYKATRLISKNECLSEELRLLYVALTRAKEKLFIVLSLKNGSRSNLNDYQMLRTLAKEINLANGINPFMVANCNSFAQWLFMILLCLPNNEALLKEAQIDFALPEFPMDSGVSFNIIEDLDTAVSDKKVYIKAKPILEKAKELKERYKFEYKSDDTIKPAKITVTEIVRNEKEKEYGDQNPEFYPQLPKLSEEIGKLSAAEKGTYTHLFMELADYENASKDAENELKRLCANGFLSKKQAEGVYIQAIEKFFDGDFYARMKSSDEVMREKHFLVSFKDIKLDERYNEFCSPDGMLQGIADCIFKEGDGYVLVDYKTDNFKYRSELLKYQTQLELYKAALDLILDFPIKSCYIYSFKLCEGVEIPLS